MNDHSRRRPLPAPTRRRTARLALALAIAGLATACTSSRPITTPMLDTRNPELKVPRRVEAARLAWDSARQDPDQRAKARAIFKSLVWSTQTPRPLRLDLVRYLLDDDSPEGEADSRSFTTLRLPTEPDREVVGMMAVAAARNSWTEAAPSLVRRLAEPIDDIPDRERVEAQALMRLEPGTPLERIVFDVFANPDTGPAEIAWAKRVQADAWSLLSRLDPDGSTRRSLILDPGVAAMGASGPLLRDLRVAVDELGIVPDTAMELEWLRTLRDPSDSEAARNQAWWREVSSLVTTLDDGQRAGLALRHLEPIRLASHKSPRLLKATRAELISLLAEKLEGRTRHRRTAENNGVYVATTERFEDWADELSWGDALALSIIDDALHAPGIVQTVFQQVELDRRDHQTEYGGVLEAVTAPDGRVGGYRMVLFPPRPRDRVSDERFITSEDMVAYSTRGIAHYHMHVQKPKNYDYAGPSVGDSRNARLSGRNCLVFTSISDDRLDIDYYQPDGVVIDLGEIAR
ncbi:MAG: hypothetical protein H6810_06305 [Phycisphaeraceae bacterium]|nr:MAG: hypothetical protein H6810_06305 [Phycisphaeraceae bacterium]